MAYIVSLASYKFLPANNGGQKNIALFYKYLGKLLRLTTYTVKDNDNFLAENYHAVNFFSKSRFRYINPIYFFLLRPQLKKDGATHLMIEHPYLGWLAIILKKACSLELIVHSHNIESLRFYALKKSWWKLLWHYEKFVHRRSDYNLFITEEDKRYAIQNFKLNPEKCMVATYGIESNAPPTGEERTHAKGFLVEKYHLTKDERILLFVGAFDYQPNRDAFAIIKEHVSPILKERNFRHKILVCGPHLSPDDYSRDPNIIITGFVEDISLYFKGADVFINPVIEGGGIKTKVVEALGYNLNVVSTESGALGVPSEICNDKLLVSKDGHWTSFVQNIENCLLRYSNISKEFYQHFFWGAITQQTVNFLKKDA